MFSCPEKRENPCFSTQNARESRFFDPKCARIRVFRPKKRAIPAFSTQKTSESRFLVQNPPRAQERKKGRVTTAMKTPLGWLRPEIEGGRKSKKNRKKCKKPYKTNAKIDFLADGGCNSSAAVFSPWAQPKAS